MAQESIARLTQEDIIGETDRFATLSVTPLSAMYRIDGVHYAIIQPYYFEDPRSASGGADTRREYAVRVYADEGANERFGHVRLSTPQMTNIESPLEEQNAVFKDASGVNLAELTRGPAMPSNDMVDDAENRKRYANLLLRTVVARAINGDGELEETPDNG